MNVREVKQIVGNYPDMKAKQAQILTDFIHEHNISSILECGGCINHPSQIKTQA